MLRADDFQIAGVRLVVVTPNHAEFKQATALAILLGRFAQRFDGDVQAIGMPVAERPEVLRIILKSADGRWQFLASPSRITCVWSRLETDHASELGALVTSCREPIEHYVRSADISIGRLAIVTTRASATENPADVLIGRFCRDDVKAADRPEAPLRNSLNFEIHNHKRYELTPGLTVNSWVRCRTGALGGAPAVTVEQDMNTLTEEIESRRFCVDDLETFFNTCVSDSLEILTKYFP